MDEKTSKFITNSYQTPNSYVDDLMWLLTPTEWMVLSYAVRRIFGFQKRQDRISISQFESGMVSKTTGERLDCGTGLGRDTIIKALAELIRYRVMVQTDQNDPRLNHGAEYSLPLDITTPDYNGLYARLQEKAQANKAKMSTAIMRSIEARSVRPTALSRCDLHTKTSRKPEKTSYRRR
jgi:hypothetical protein